MECRLRGKEIVHAQAWNDMMKSQQHRHRNTIATEILKINAARVILAVRQTARVDRMLSRNSSLCNAGALL